MKKNVKSGANYKNKEKNIKKTVKKIMKIKHIVKWGKLSNYGENSKKVQKI